MKFKFIIAQTILVLFLSSSASGQDLIERTRQGISTTYQKSKANEMALWLDKKRTQKKFPTQHLFRATATQKSNYSEHVSDLVRLDLKPKALAQIVTDAPENFTMVLPVDFKHNIELELVKVDVLSDNFELKTSDGKTHALKQMNTPVFYRGVVKGNPNSIASISLFEGEIIGLVSDDQGNYVLGKLGNQQQNQYALYNDKKLNEEFSFECSTERKPIDPILKSQIESSVQKSNAGGLGCVKIYVECDNQMYRDHGSSIGSVTSYILALINNSAAIFQLENIKIELNYLFIWTGPDPHRNKDNTTELLNSFRPVIPNTNSDLYHFLTTRDVGGGIAFINQLVCGSGPYAVSGNLGTRFDYFPKTSWDVYVFTHETGHNLGSRHTHDCVWGPNGDQALDGCANSEGNCPNGPIPSDGGTIMSYCSEINFNKGFGDEPGALIRGLYSIAYFRGCIGECDCDNLISRRIPQFDRINISSGIYTAKEKISSSGRVTNSNVVFRAGGYVILQPGFQALASNTSSFIAQVGNIVECDQALALPSPSEAISFIQDSIDQLSSTLPKTLSNLILAPNPFKNSTTINFYMEQSGKVSLVMYNIIGMEVYRSEQSFKAGDNQVNFENTQSLSPGIYYLYLKTANTTLTTEFVISE